VLNSQQGFPVFKTVIEANYVYKRDDIYQSFQLTEEDEKQIRQLAKDPHIGEKVNNFHSLQFEIVLSSLLMVNVLL
jgi:DNA replicative helicase MCM subunit Mcm2 (Cdc46/Mcm family)